MRYITFYNVFQKRQETICLTLPYSYLCKLNQSRYRANMLIKYGNIILLHEYKVFKSFFGHKFQAWSICYGSTIANLVFLLLPCQFRQLRDFDFTQKDNI